MARRAARAQQAGRLARTASASEREAREALERQRRHPSGHSHCHMRADTRAGGWGTDPNSGAAHVVNQWIICLLFCNIST